MDVERLDQLSREQAAFFGDARVRRAVQGLHEYVIRVLVIYELFTVYNLQRVRGGCSELRSKILGEKGLVEESEKGVERRRHTPELDPDP